jgi:hypothetical protein
MQWKINTIINGFEVTLLALGLLWKIKHESSIKQILGENMFISTYADPPDFTSNSNALSIQSALDNEHFDIFLNNAIRTSFSKFCIDIRETIYNDKTIFDKVKTKPWMELAWILRTSFSHDPSGILKFPDSNKKNWKKITHFVYTFSNWSITTLIEGRIINESPYKYFHEFKQIFSNPNWINSK